jgi:eukaryotic-like serine/threonine-protein kinase
VPTDADKVGDRSEFWAFISYSHADRAWADWLHRALERYRVPYRLVGTATAAGLVPRRIAPVFLDRIELAATTDLDSTIADALRASRSLIVICSPAAVASPRVIQEIEAFHDLKQGRVLCLIVAGRPNAEERGVPAVEECFPLPLRAGRIAGQGNFAAPLAADVRPGKGGRQEALHWYRSREIRCKYRP